MIEVKQIIHAIATNMYALVVELIVADVFDIQQIWAVYVVECKKQAF